jgi:uncharacterized protein YcbX
MPKLARINIHPIKSLDPQPVDQAVLLASGALQHDRRFALRDRAGEFINGKRTPAVHLLRTSFEPAANLLTLRLEGARETHIFDVDANRRELAEWFADFFAMPLEFVENPSAGFPDDTDSPGPTVIGAATLAEVASWFPGLSMDDARARFRANLEIDGVEPFWEDRLVADGTKVVRFRIGEAELLGTTACQRCPVPSRNPRTGEPIREFAKIFSRRREEALRAWAPGSRFDHFYRLAVNTRPAHEKQCVIRVGDEVQILGIA